MTSQKPTSVHGLFGFKPSDDEPSGGGRLTPNRPDVLNLGNYSDFHGSRGVLKNVVVHFSQLLPNNSEYTQHPTPAGGNRISLWRVGGMAKLCQEGTHYDIETIFVKPRFSARDFNDYDVRSGIRRF